MTTKHVKQLQVTLLTEVTNMITSNNCFISKKLNNVGYDMILLRVYSRVMISTTRFDLPSSSQISQLSKDSE